MAGATVEAQETAILGVIVGTANLTVIAGGTAALNVANLRGSNRDNVSRTVTGKRDSCHVVIEFASGVVGCDITRCVASFGNIVPGKCGNRNCQQGNNHCQGHSNRNHSGKRPFHYLFPLDNYIYLILSGITF